MCIHFLIAVPAKLTHPTHKTFLGYVSHNPRECCRKQPDSCTVHRSRCMCEHTTLWGSSVPGYVINKISPFHSQLHQESSERCGECHALSCFICILFPWTINRHNESWTDLCWIQMLIPLLANIYKLYAKEIVWKVIKSHAIFTVIITADKSLIWDDQCLYRCHI